MKYYDRYTSQMVTSLPSRMDLGRFVVIDNDTIRDLTNSDVNILGDYVVRESLLEETNQNVHDLLHTIATTYISGSLNVTPIIQNFNIKIKEFEKVLNEHKSHLRSIVNNPHALLDKNTMKVNIGRAKRISTRSYQHLAHHSEDWEKMSIISPKPRKILHEELIIDFTIYENLLLKAFLHETIQYLNKRIKETADISKFFLSIFGTKWICSNCYHIHEGVEKPSTCPNCKNGNACWIEEINTIWHEKIDRRNALVGRAIKSDKTKDSNEINRLLVTLKKELVKLEHSPLFEEFPRHSVGTVVYHDTNVLNSHKHYKYLKILWSEFKKQKEQTEEDNLFLDHQAIMNNMRIYVEALFVYSLTHMNFEIKKHEGHIIAYHKYFPQITIYRDDYGVLKVSTNNVEYNIITLGGVYDIDNIGKLPDNLFCFCFNDYQKQKANTEHINFVNPIDTDSIECSGRVIRKLIMQHFVEIINKHVDYKHSLRDFVSVISCKEINFDNQCFTYSFLEKIPSPIDEKKVCECLRDFPLFKERNRREQNILLKEMSTLVQDINEHITIIKNTLICPKCSSQYRSNNIRYLVCNDCGFICDLSKGNSKLFHCQKDELHANISIKGWGMDLVC